MLRTLENYLKEDYIVLLLDFQEVETANFASGAVFSLTFAKKLSKAAGYTEAADKEKIQRLLSKYKKDNPDGGLDELFEILSIMCAEVSRPIVLMIDKVGHTGSCERYLCIHIRLSGSCIIDMQTNRRKDYRQ